MKYADAVAAKEARRPIAVVEVPPRVWAQTWLDRPLEAVTVGLRSLGETVLGEVTGTARHLADKAVPGGSERDRLWADEYNGHVMRGAISRALTQPDCADVPWWDHPDLMAGVALSPEGAAWLYARFAAAVVSASVLASEEESADLLVALTAVAGRAGELSAARRSQVARHLRAALDVIEGA